MRIMHKEEEWRGFADLTAARRDACHANDECSARVELASSSSSERIKLSLQIGPIIASPSEIVMSRHSSLRLTRRSRDLRRNTA